MFVLKTKEKKGKNTPPNKSEIINKEGLGPSEVALRATSPDTYTLQKKKQNITSKNRNKTNKEGLGPSEVALLATSPDP